MQELIRKRFAQHQQAVAASLDALSQRIAAAAQIMIDAVADGAGIYIFGNGGSAADAQHIACELVGRFLKERRAIRAAALTTDAAVMTAVANDYDFARIYARQLEAAARPGDVAVAISTSGNSANVLAGLEKARQIGMKTIVLTGAGGGKCAAAADVLLSVESPDTPRVQEVHALIYHILCEIVEQSVR